MNIKRTVQDTDWKDRINKDRLKKSVNMNDEEIDLFMEEYNDELENIDKERDEIYSDYKNVYKNSFLALGSEPPVFPPKPTEPPSPSEPPVFPPKPNTEFPVLKPTEQPQKTEFEKVESAVNSSLNITEESETESGISNDEYNPSTPDYVNETTCSSLSDYGIFNTPHQFTPLADSRYSNSDWRGRVYTEHFLINTPMVIFKIGKPDFMSGESDADSSVLSRIMEQDEDNMTSFVETLFNSKKNQMYYYTFKDDFTNYCKYVNTMIRYTAIRMDLTKAKNASEDYHLFNLEKDTIFKSGSGNWITNLFGNALQLNNYLAFYVEGPSTSASESGSNSTTDSQLASGTKSLGQSKRELDFLFGTNTKSSGDNSSSYENYASGLSNLYGKASSGLDSVLNKLSGTFTSVASGANLLFPEIWQDSSYRSSYNIEIKLTSPYGDKESIFRNIYIPFFCILGMVLPRQSGKQGYIGPYLIQAFSKGWFSCNMGMIEGIDVKKAGSSGLEWSIDDLPTSIDITLNIKDLYPTIMATCAEQVSAKAFSNNIGLIEYLKVMAGIQLTDFDPLSNIERLKDGLEGKINDIPTKIYNSATAIIGAGAKKVINTIFGGIN